MSKCHFYTVYHCKIIPSCYFYKKIEVPQSVSNFA